MPDHDISRRGFLAAPALLGAQSPNSAVRVGFIGTGNRGSYLLRHMLDVPGIQVVAICDLDAARMKAAETQAVANGHHPKLYDDFRKLLDDKTIDAVVIATPVDRHKEMAVAALEVAKHVYSEKPMALTPQECAAVVQAAKSAKGIYQAGFQLRHDPNRRAAMEFIHSGGIGGVLFLQGYRHTSDLPRDTPWYFNAQVSGDNIVEQACHILDLFTWAAGKHPLRAYGSGGINLYKDEPPGRTTMDNYAVIYEFAEGVRLSFTHLYFDPPGFAGIRERVYGSKGAIDLATATWIELGKKGERKLEVPDAAKDSTYLSLEAFIENARGRKTPVNDAESARRSTLVAMLGRKAIYEKRVVEWKEVDL